jgi:hypothetical protein
MYSSEPPREVVVVVVVLLVVEVEVIEGGAAKANWRVGKGGGWAGVVVVVKEMRVGMVGIVGMAVTGFVAVATFAL